MSPKLYGALAAALVLGSAPFAHAGYRTVDLSPIVNQGFVNGGWYINGFAPFFDLAGQTTLGNQGSNVPFSVANVYDGRTGFLNFWYGLDDGSHTNLFNGPLGSVTIAVNGTGVNTVYTLGDNVFGNAGADEFSVTFHGTAGDLTEVYVGADNTKDYNTPNCATTGCDLTPNATDWYNDGGGVIQQLVRWNLPTGFGLTSITFTQDHPVDGAILAGVTLGVPEPATWAMMIGGFGLAGAMLRRRRAPAAA